MDRKLTLVAGAAAGALTALLLRRRRRGGRTVAGVDPRAVELRRKLAEARDTVADEEDFEAAGMAGETIVEDEPRHGEAAPSPEDVEAARRRVHEEARKAADDMRRSGGSEEA